MMCCKTIAIEELDKPAGKWCAHAVAGKGCGVYAERPAVCRTFFCLWRYDASLDDDWRPDKARFVTQPSGLWIHGDPGAPAAWRAPKYYPTIKLAAARQAEKGRFIVVTIGNRATMILPDRDVEIGALEVKDVVVVVPSAMAPAGARRIRVLGPDGEVKREIAA